MDTTALFSAINPIVAAFFFLTFFSIWRRQPSRPHVLNWSLTYVAAATGFTAACFIEMASVGVSLVTNACFGLVALFTARGICLRCSGRSPDKFLFAVYGLSLATSFAFTVAFASVLARGAVLSVGMAVLLMTGAIAILRDSNRDRLDLGIAVVLMAVSAVLVLRPVAALILEGDLAVGGEASNTLWIVSLKVMAHFSWIAFAILFLVRIATDLVQQLAEQTVTDPLTGVLNRRGFVAEAVSAVEKAAKALPAAVLLCDIDHFKKVNDTYGHGVGDEVIRRLASVLRAATGTDGIVGRLGGEEFAVVLSNTNLQSARALAEGIRTAFAEQPGEGLPLSCRTTVSVGIALSADNEDLDALLNRADAALYRAKGMGRNRVEAAADAAHTVLAANAA